jgi:hypothetical protein
MNRFFVLVCLGFAIECHASDVQGFNAMFKGTGRACSGTLKISAKQVTWNTPFSKCSTRMFTASEFDAGDGKKRFLYELRGVGEKCQYQTVVLRHPDPLQTGASWEATGYRNKSDFETNSVAHSMSCAVIRSK